MADLADDIVVAPDVRLKTECDCGQRIGNEVDKQYLRRQHDHRQSHHDPAEHGNDFTYIAGYHISHELAYIGVYGPAVFNRTDQCGKIVIEKYHVSRLLCDFCSLHTHRYTYVSFFDGRRIIHTVPRHGTYMTL